MGLAKKDKLITYICGLVIGFAAVAYWMRGKREEAVYQADNPSAKITSVPAFLDTAELLEEVQNIIVDKNQLSVRRLWKTAWVHPYIIEELVLSQEEAAGEITVVPVSRWYYRADALWALPVGNFAEDESWAALMGRLGLQLGQEVRQEEPWLQLIWQDVGLEQFEDMRKALVGQKGLLLTVYPDYLWGVAPERSEG